MQTEPSNNYYYMRQSMQQTENKLFDLKYTVYLTQIKALNEAKRALHSLLYKGALA